MTSYGKVLCPACETRMLDEISWLKGLEKGIYNFYADDERKKSMANLIKTLDNKRYIHPSLINPSFEDYKEMATDLIDMIEKHGLNSKKIYENAECHGLVISLENTRA